MRCMKCDVLAIALVFFFSFGNPYLLAEIPKQPTKRMWLGVNLDITRSKTPIIDGNLKGYKDSTEKGKLAIITEPSGAEVRIDRFDQKALAQTPAVLNVSTGEHMVQIKLTGYKTVHRVVVIVASRVNMLKMRLKK